MSGGNQGANRADRIHTKAQMVCVSMEEGFLAVVKSELSFKERVDVRKAKKRIQLMPAFPGT